jgi:hypothetical protein
MSEGHRSAPDEAPPQATTLVLTAALAHYLDRHVETGSSRSDDILRVAIAGQLLHRR